MLLSLSAGCASENAPREEATPTATSAPKDTAEPTVAVDPKSTVEPMVDPTLTPDVESKLPVSYTITEDEAFQVFKNVCVVQQECFGTYFNSMNWPGKNAVYSLDYWMEAPWSTKNIIALSGNQMSAPMPDGRLVISRADERFVVTDDASVDMFLKELGERYIYNYKSSGENSKVSVKLLASTLSAPLTYSSEGCEEEISLLCRVEIPNYTYIDYSVSLINNPADTEEWAVNEIELANTGALDLLNYAYYYEDTMYWHDEWDQLTYYYFDTDLMKDLDIYCGFYCMGTEKYEELSEYMYYQKEKKAVEEGKTSYYSFESAEEKYGFNQSDYSIPAPDYISKMSDCINAIWDGEQVMLDAWLIDKGVISDGVVIIKYDEAEEGSLAHSYSVEQLYYKLQNQKFSTMEYAMETYKNYLAPYKNYAFKFIYVNEDTIPEVVCASLDGRKSYIFSYSGGGIASYELLYDTFSYREKAGLLNDYRTNQIGTVNVIMSLKEKKFERIAIFNELTQYLEMTLGEKYCGRVSEEEFYSAFEEWYPTEGAIEISLESVKEECKDFEQLCKELGY